MIYNIDDWNGNLIIGRWHRMETVDGEKRGKVKATSSGHIDDYQVIAAAPFFKVSEYFNKSHCRWRHIIVVEVENVLIFHAVHQPNRCGIFKKPLRPNCIKVVPITPSPRPFLAFKACLCTIEHEEYCII